MDEPTKADLEAYRHVRDWVDARRAAWQSAHLGTEDSLFTVATSMVPLNRNRGWHHAWSDYEWGYFSAATTLVEDYVTKVEADVLVYPILFLYRHYVELKLKSIILEAGASIPCEMPSGANNEHNVTKLWKMISDLLVQHGKNKMLRGSEGIERVLAQLTQIDPSSMETRYALKKDMKTATLDQVRSLDLENFKTVMIKLRSELDELEMLFQYVHECWWDEGPAV
ncbi:MAG: hypothetical protein WAL71_00260 [Terriglobales bacterium]